VLSFIISGTVIEWRGPAPFYFVATPAAVTSQIEEHKKAISYGWGVVPATVTIGETEITTSLIPKAGSFYIPLKDAIRKPNGISVGDNVELVLKL